MKKLSMLFAVVAITTFVFTGCKKESSGTKDEGAWFEPEQKQRSLMLDFTATWCTWCGVWGHPTFHKAENTLGDNAIAFNVQGASSELPATQYKPANDTPYYSRHLPELTNGLKGVTISGYPTLIVNNKSGYGANSENTMVADANAFNGNAPVANVNFGISKSSSGFTAKTTVKFFQATSGEFHLALFITQNNINHRQNVGGTYVFPYDHDNIIRAFPISNSKEASGSIAGLNTTFGKPIISGNITSGQFVNTELTYTADNKATLMPAGWNVFTWNPNNTADLYVTAIIWKKDTATGKYIFVNAVRKAL